MLERVTAGSRERSVRTTRGYPFLPGAIRSAAASMISTLSIQWIVGGIEGEARFGDFHWARSIEVLRIVAVEEAGSIEDDRGEEFRDLGLMRLPDAGQSQHAGVSEYRSTAWEIWRTLMTRSTWPSRAGLVETMEPWLTTRLISSSSS
ncbi:hypothetical protein DRW48_14765 [Paracoccus suum]|uniref:Uncharacterized protein n=1 Tax=Paracoccus suum TaxID=2259340 RepID=A0A344PN12_9RHOB|nr:hypothetical protein DRW48_14765 [Paracoccus suum]